MLREAESAHKRPKNLQEKKVVQLVCTTIYSQVTTLPISALLRLCSEVDPVQSPLKAESVTVLGWSPM
jgi:hypothetical protein